MNRFISVKNCYKLCHPYYRQRPAEVIEAATVTTAATNATTVAAAANATTAAANATTNATTVAATNTTTTPAPADDGSKISNSNSLPVNNFDSHRSCARD